MRGKTMKFSEKFWNIFQYKAEESVHNIKSFGLFLVVPSVFTFVLSIPIFAVLHFTVASDKDSLTNMVKGLAYFPAFVLGIWIAACSLLSFLSVAESVFLATIEEDELSEDHSIQNHFDPDELTKLSELKTS